MTIFGITGTLCSGKTTVTNIFRKFGIKVFDADKTIHYLLKYNKQIKAKIRKEFPKAFIDNEIDRKKLGKLVFDNRPQILKLESILYPSLRKAIVRFKRKYQHEKIIILDIPLLFEKNFQIYCDKTITVYTNKHIRKKRCQQRGITSEKAKAITKNQYSDRLKIKLASITINNSYNRTITKQQIHYLLTQQLNH